LCGICAKAYSRPLRCSRAAGNVNRRASHKNTTILQYIRTGVASHPLAASAPEQQRRTPDGPGKYENVVSPVLGAPLKNLRSWPFIFCFLSIGLTTRFGELAKAGIRPFAAFSLGVVVNVALGFLLSAVVFASYWANMTR
jgi:hypothetical protein